MRILSAYALARASPRDKESAVSVLTEILNGTEKDLPLPLNELVPQSDSDRAVVSALCDALREKEPGDRFPTSYVLWWLGQTARPPLRGAAEWQKDHPFVRGLAGEALKQIDPEAARKAGVR